MSKLSAFTQVPLLSSFTAFLLGVFLTFIITLTVCVMGLVYQDRRYRDTIYPNVAIDGHNLNGVSLDKVKSYYEDLNKKLQTIQLEIFFQDAPIATYSGEMLNVRSNGGSIAEQAYLITRTGDTSTRLKHKLQVLFGLKRFSFTSNVEYDLEPVQDTLGILERQYNIEPKDAQFTMKDGKVTAFITEKNGLKLNTEEVLTKIRSILTNESIGKSTIAGKPYRLTLQTSVLKPDVTLSETNTFGIEEIIGVGTSDYSGSIPGRVHNLLLATQRLHGVLIPKGEEFSFNKALGEVSGSTGYQPAYIILNGRTVLGDGGGVCQTSTTMFRVALASGLPITVWAPHAYRVHYYENDGKPGRDATTYSPSQDFRFKNDTPAAILIQTEADTENSLLKYTFWGKKDDRKISISDVSMGNSIPAPPVKEEEDPTRPRGTRVQVDWAAAGLKAWFDYKVTRGNETIQDKRFVSNYRPWQAVFLVGTKD